MDEEAERDAPGPATAIEREARGVTAERIPLSAVKLQRLFDHQRWLATEGRTGKPLHLRQKFASYKKDFINNDLDGMDFSRAEFEYICFLECSLKEVRFTGATLQHVDFLGCNLAGADFRGAKLITVTFEESNLKQALFDPSTEWEGPERVIRYHAPRNFPHV